jgi:tetratricopeptide (TPR) repeat protein
MSRSFILAFLVTGFIACNNRKENSSPYEALLSRPPYTALTDSIRKEPNRDDLLFRRAILLNSNDETGPALVDFKKAWSLKKEERYALATGNLLLDRQPDSAVLFLKEALAEIPQSTLLSLTLARAYSAGNKIVDALNLVNSILGQNPEQVDVLKLKADLLDRSGNKSELLPTLEKAYNLAPFDVELNYMYALKLAESGNSRVIALCDSLIRADSLGIHADPYYYKGIYYSNSGDKTRAIGLFDEALKHDYNFMDAYIEKGAILYEQKKYTEAAKVFSLAITISNQFAPAYYWLAKCQEATGQREEAKLNYQRAYGLDKTFTEAKEAVERIGK